MPQVALAGLPLSRPAEYDCLNLSRSFAAPDVRMESKAALGMFAGFADLELNCPVLPDRLPDPKQDLTVPMRREFCAHRVDIASVLGRQPAHFPQKWKDFPVFSRVAGNLPPEIGSHVTACTTAISMTPISQ